MYKFYVTDWSPNGTNGLLVYRHGKQVDFLDEVLFGVDVNKLGPAKYLSRYDSEPVYSIPKTLIKRHVTCGPFGMGFVENCKRLRKYLGVNK